MPRTPTICDTALKLHDRGLWIVPCNGKGPTWKDWPTKRRSREELADALNGSKLNIALVLNQCGLIDVECDTPEAEPALLAMFGGSIPPTPTWTSNRGKHRLFRRPDGLPERAVIEVDGVEFRIGNGRGAASVIPPSRHPAGPTYRWVPGLSLDDVAPAELPPAVVDRLKDNPPPAAPAGPDERIAEGARNDTLFARAVALRAVPLPEETIATVLLDLNARLCDPPLPESEVRAIARSAASGEQPKIGFVARLLGKIELWHSENDEPFASLPQGEHRENWMIGKRSRPFRRWLSKLFYEAVGEMLSASALADLAAMLEGKAVFDGPRHQLFRRVAGLDDKTYLDLCDDEWRAVEIDADGWRVVSDPPVKFRRAKAMMALPLPVKTPASQLRRLLLPFLNVSPVQWPLVAGWLVATFRPVGPYPLLKLLGEQGSAKTTTARVLRLLVDPNAAPVRAEPRDTRDLMIAANNGWLLCLDNLSTVKPDLSDALCRLATGGGFATRTLYTDEDESIFDAQRPVILTSIEEVGCRSDLLERSLIVELPTIPEDKRRAEKTFWAAFDRARPRILGALLDAVSGGIRRLPEMERRAGVELPRLADFFLWGEAVEGSLGMEPGTFAEAFRANREAATQVVLESNPAIEALIRYLHKKPQLEMTATKLLESLGYVDSDLKVMPGWPKLPRVLSAILRRAAPNLRQVGIVAMQDTRGGGDTREKVWRIVRADGGETEQPRVEKPPKTALGKHLADRTGRKGSKNP